MMRGAGRIELPPNTLTHECRWRVVIPATGDLEELFLGPGKISSIVGPYYIGHSSPSYKAFNSGNACAAVHRTNNFQVYCSGGETRKQEHPSFLRAAPNRNKERAKLIHSAVTEGWFQITKPFFR